MRTLVTVARSGRPEHNPEEVEVLVDTDEPRFVVLHVEDGERIEIDRAELDAALEAA